MKNTLITFALGLLLATPLLNAADLAPTALVAGKTLKLNGTGIRKATIFHVKVYNAGLYLESPSSDSEAILASSQVKKLDMHFVHDVGAAKLRDAWREGIEKNCKISCSTLGPSLEKLNTLMVDIKSGDEMSFVFQPDRVEVSVKGNSASSIGDAAFSRALLSVWLGKEPPNESLKEGLLGHKEG